MSSDEDTADDVNTGGYGKFSHGKVALTHQHWVDQVIVAGSFGVHCTEAPEAKHKNCMAMASSRVRHLDENTTRSSMLRYLFYYEFFEDLNKTRFGKKRPVLEVLQPKHKLSCPLIDPFTNKHVFMGTDFCGNSGALQSLFIHPEVRVARVELLDMVCGKLGMPTTTHSYQVLGKLKWSFGQKLTIDKCVMRCSSSAHLPVIGVRA